MALRDDVQALVEGLLQDLDVHESADEYVPKLVANTTTNPVSANAAKKAERSVGEKSPNPVEFTAMYEKLKASGVKETDRYLEVLSRILEDKALIAFLSKVGSGMSAFDTSSRGIHGGSNAPDYRASMSPAPTMSHNTSAITPSSGLNIHPHDVSTKGRTPLPESYLSPTSIRKLEAVRLSTPPVDGKQQQKKKNGPTMPSWFFDRPLMTVDYVKHADQQSEGTEKGEALSTMDLSVQEAVIVEEVLYAMLGIEGRYIKAVVSPNHKVTSFQVEPSLDPSMANIVNRILPICSQYVHIARFVESHSIYDYGLVNHAFCSAIRSLLKEYMILVAQLEHQFKNGQLNLQKLWFYVQPSIRTMDLLERVTSEVSENQITGGALLNVIHTWMSTMGGDGDTKDLFLFLIEKASIPYFEILEQWIYSGYINDPYEEFLIEEHEEFRKENLVEDYNDSYWEQRYTIRREQTPAFLQKVSEKILTTGKYLNVIRECGRDVESSVREKIVYSPHDREYVEQIEKSFEFASKTLLDLFINEKQLVERLKSIKHYFLLDQGDFFVHFMDIAEEELRKSMGVIAQQKLETLLELAIRTSIAASDPFKEDLTCDLLPYNLINQLLRIINVSQGIVQINAVNLGGSKSPDTFGQVTGTGTSSNVTGLEAFTLGYNVAWPVSLIISRKALTKYQLIFRHLFHCKHVERQLCNTWLNHQTTKEFDVRMAFSVSYCLRQRMLHFLHNFQYYMMLEVIEPNWHKLLEKFRSVKTIDEVLKHHNEFLDTCLKECMLTNPRLLKILTKLMTTCVIFSNYTERFTRTLTVDGDLFTSPDEFDAKRESEASDGSALQRRQTKIKVASSHVKKIIADKGYLRTIKKFEENFNIHLKLLIDALNAYSYTESDPHLANLCTRLDYNGFYAREFQTGGASSST